jgi:hypothetical protein
LSAYQLRIMIAVHLPGAVGQRVHLLASAARLALALSASEAFLPWHPLAVLAYLIFALLGIAGVIQSARRMQAPASQDGPLRAIAAFGLLFGALVVLSGLGGKPRSALLLAPALAPVAALIGGRLSTWAQNALLIFLALWSGVGIAHMLGRYGLAKSTMNDRPEQVVQFVRADANGTCAIVETADPGLTFVLAQAHLPGVIVFSADDVDSSPAPALSQAGACRPMRLYLVRSYTGPENYWTRSVRADQVAMARLIVGTSQLNSFSADPEAARKRRLARLPLVGGDLGDAAGLPDYRFVVTSGPIDPNQIATLQQQAPDFAVVR